MEPAQLEQSGPASTSEGPTSPGEPPVAVVPPVDALAPPDPLAPPVAGEAPPDDTVDEPPLDVAPPVVDAAPPLDVSPPLLAPPELAAMFATPSFEELPQAARLRPKKTKTRERVIAHDKANCVPRFDDEETG